MRAEHPELRLQYQTGLDGQQLCYNLTVPRRTGSVCGEVQASD